MPIGVSVALLYRLRIYFGISCVVLGKQKMLTTCDLDLNFYTFLVLNLQINYLPVVYIFLSPKFH